MHSDDRLGKLAFFGGGTGGHLYPGLAVADRASERFPGIRAVFFHGDRRVEERVLADAGVSVRKLKIGSPRGPGGWLRYSLQVVTAIREIRRILREGFDAAVGLGGYVSLPGILAARQEELPVILLEQNQVPGRANRLLAPVVSAVCCPGPEAARRLRGRCEVTGNPVRRSVIEAAAMRRRRSFQGSGKRRVLVFGGSQGARGINRSLRRALRDLREFRDRIRWLHIAGDADRAVMDEFYLVEGWEAQVWSYRPDLPRLIAESDLVISRAGGTTVAELSVLGIPAILVPYPYHADRHQSRNARVLEKAGGAVLIDEKHLGASALRRVFDEVLFSPRTWREMEAGCLSLARPGAADAVVNLLLELRKSCRRDFVSSY